ncbi:MAG TPA: DUF72 domain-containing protein [Opitutaceae bacterium]|nr:DUF72 domain-containing protein [Opitutaceae bacterium]
MPIRIGCGSWADQEYVGILYKPGLPAKKRLSGYAEHFNHIEVNSSFYATPKAATTRSWIADTPDDFTFTVKLHRAFSLSPGKTAEKGELIDALLEGAAPLIEARRLSAFFLVLPPSFAPEKKRLEELDVVAEKLRGYRLAVELRHKDWVSGAQREKTLGYFRERGLVWIAVDMPKIADSTIMPAVDEVTNDSLAYLRLHGRNPKYLEAGSAEEGHRYDYPAAELKQIAERVKGLAEKAKDVHVIANNHSHDYAPKAALALKGLLGV